MNIDFDSGDKSIKTMMTNKKEFICNKWFDLSTDFFYLKIIKFKTCNKYIILW
jgi:hypothetical protein